MKKIISILMLTIFNLVLIVSTCFFIIKPGYNIINDSTKMKVLSTEEVQNEKDKINNKYISLSDKLDAKYINLGNEISNKYIQKKQELEEKYSKLENEINAKYTKKMSDDGWYEEQQQKNSDIKKNVTDPKYAEESKLVFNEFDEKNNLDDKKDKEKNNLMIKKNSELSNISTESSKKTLKLIKGIVICFIGFFIIMGLLSKTVSIFNKLISSKNKVGESWAQVEVQLKKRYDLIPNIVEVVKGYTKHENKTLTSVVEMRNKANDTNDINKEIELNTDINNSLQKIVALQEDYPDLKADKSYLSLQNDLNEIEDEIATARSIYNNSVLNYKNIKETFPNNLFTNIFNFNDASYFEINDENKKNVKVEL